MIKVAKDTIKTIECAILCGCNPLTEEGEQLKKNVVNGLLVELNKRKTVSNSSIKFFNLLLNSILLLKNENNFKVENYVNTISKLTYNRYQIKKHIEEEQIVLTNKIREEIDTEQKTLFKMKKKVN